MRNYLKIVGIGLLIYLVHTPINSYGYANISLVFTAVYYWLVGIICKRYIVEKANQKLWILMIAPIIMGIILTLSNPKIWLCIIPYESIFATLGIFHGYYFQPKKGLQWVTLSFLSLLVYAIAYPVVANRQMSQDTFTPEKLYIQDTIPLINIEKSDTLRLTKGKTYYIDFFNTQCGYCVEKFPDTEKLYQVFKSDTNIVILSIDDGRRDSLQKIQNFSYLKPYHFPIYYDTEGNLCKTLDFHLYPQSIIADKTGKVVYHFIGYGADKARVYYETVADKIREVHKQ